MSDISGAAGTDQLATPVNDPSRFNKFFIKVSDETGLPETPPPEPVASAPVAPPPAPEVIEPNSLAAKIRSDREARASKVAQETEARTYRERAEKAEEQLASLSKKDMIADPIGWADGHNLTPEERAALGETLLYSLVPDKATPEVRIKMMEARQERTQKLNETKAEQAAREQVQAQATETERQYIAAIEASTKTIPPGTFPGAETWFGEDQSAYVQSLYATAVNLAEAARAEGKVADLSIGAVARVLEADLVPRLNRWAVRKPAEAIPPEQKPAEIGKPANDVVMSTKGLGGGPPRPPAVTEAERVARAAEALFRTK